MTSSDFCPVQADDDLIPLVEEGAAPGAGHAHAAPWKVLVVDDDADVHQATELVLRDLLIEERPLTLIHAYSAAEAREVVAATQDLAVMLLDVVMESEDAGLQLVGEVRQTLKRQALRIILRTGQPGYAPELETIRSYDINDYKTKSELTRVRLFTSLTTAVRAYHQMRMHEAVRAGLEQVVQASTELYRLRGLQMFAQGVVSQLCALLNMAPEGLICAQAGLENEDEPSRVIAAAGRYSHLVHQPLTELDPPDVRAALAQCLQARRSVYAADSLRLYFATEDERGLAAYVEIRHELDELDRHLLEVFCSSMAVGFKNLLLYGRLLEQAYLDPLLHIPNLNRMLELLASQDLNFETHTLAVLDIDDFADINDTLGHEFGDAALRAVVQRLGEHLPHSTLARLGSDVFAVLGPSSEVAPAPMLRCFDEVFDVLGQRVRVSATLGLLRLAGCLRSGTALLKDAHVALKQAKHHQRGSAVYFSPLMGHDARERMHLLSGLREAFQARHLFVVYQPKVDLATGQACGLEALLRWRTADGQMVPPARFIPLAEQAGMMVALGTFVLRSACQQLARLRNEGHGGLHMAVNVSQAQLREPGFVDVLRQAMADAGVPPQHVELEITESMAAEDVDRTCQLLAEIHALGVSIAIDDFGTGFSSLSVLRHLRAERLKIDRSFVQELDEDDSIARMVIGLALNLGMSVTAEGVETEAQRQTLHDLGCHEAQGWLFARPMEEAPLLAWLGQRSG